MLGVAIDAAAGVLAEESGDALLEPAEAGEVGRRPLQPPEIGMVVDRGVAGFAGFVADRDEGLDVAGLAIVRERRHGRCDRLPESHIRSA